MSGAGLDEFGLIARYFAPLAAAVPGALGLTDDGALLDTEPGRQLVITTDTMVAGVHFLPDDPPDLVARKLLRVNLSDLGSMGAKPLVYTLNTAFGPDVDEAWIAAFASGLQADQKTFGIDLIGGDTVAMPGPTTLTVTAIGSVPTGRALRRRDARAGDVVYVTGTIGDGALGLAVLRGELAGLDGAARAALSERYRLPRPRVALGVRLVGLAHGAIDVSDGLLADLGHICATSGLGARIEAGRIPLSPAAQQALSLEPARIAAVLGGGDDYELLFTAPESHAAQIAEQASLCDIPITAIGRMTTGQGVTVVDAAGKPLIPEVAGYRHFH